MTYTPTNAMTSLAIVLLKRVRSRAGLLLGLTLLIPALQLSTSLLTQLAPQVSPTATVDRVLAAR